MRQRHTTTRRRRRRCFSEKRSSRRRAQPRHDGGAFVCNLKEREEKARSKMTLFCMGSSKAKKTTFCEEDKFSWCVRSVLTRMPAIITTTTRSTRCRCRTDRFRTWRRSSFWVSRRARRRRRRSIGPPFFAFLLKVVVALLLLFLCLLFEQR